jgi:hypothetical protein
MARSPLLLPGLLGLLLAAGLAVPASSWLPAHGPVYTVAQLQAQLARDPAAVVGRTVGVRGIAIPAACSTWDAEQDFPCPDRWRQGIVDPDGVTLLPLTVGAANPLLAFVRRVPLLGDLLPAPQALDWGEVATYRVQVRALPQGSCGMGRCVAAILLEAAL